MSLLESVQPSVRHLELVLAELLGLMKNLGLDHRSTNWHCQTMHSREPLPDEGVDVSVLTGVVTASLVCSVYVLLKGVEYH